MLTHFCEEHSFDIYDTYVDDGFSGLSFSRPDFQRLLGDIDAGMIDVVVTKDLSRLGRDYIQTGYYVDYYFRQHNVRYIAVNDGIDTAHDDNDIAPFKNILNDLYAKDISRKVKSAKRQRAMRGYYISAQPPYGYKSDPDDGNHLIVDDDAAAVVHQIFDFALQQLSPREIADKMTNLDVMTPSAYKASHEDHRFDRYLADGKSSSWCVETIRQILNNRVYRGDMVNHKEERKSYKTKARRRVPYDEQIIVPDTHAAIIDADTFDKVQQILEKRKHARRRCANSPLEGYVFCGECGSKMTIATKYNKQGNRILFRCTKHFQQPNVCMHNHAVYLDVLTDKVKQEVITQMATQQYVPKQTQSDTSKLPSQLTASVIRQWVDHIEIGEEPFTGENKDKIIVHFADQTQHRKGNYWPIQDLFR